MDNIVSFFTNVCNKLNALQIPYMITGSAAMNFYAVARTTQDLDVIIELEEQQIEMFLGAFPNHYYHQPSIVTEIRRQGMFNLIDFETGYKIDFIISKNTSFAQMAFSRRHQSNAFGSPVYVISLEDLVISKINWIQQIYSDRQANDVQNLLQDSNIDKGYIMDWIEKLRLNTYQIIL